MSNAQAAVGSANYAALIVAAKKALSLSYSPYSRFAVGAAVQMQDGSIITGTNIENASYGLTICAERVAIFRAIAEGRRGIRAIAVVGANARPCPPCGACRQVIFEFSDASTEVVTEGPDGKAVVREISELLPEAFGPKDLGVPK